MALIDLLMQFRNDGTESVIYVPPPSLLFDINVRFTNGASVKSLVYNPYNSDNPFRTTITRDDLDYRPSMFKKIATSPSILEPGAFREFREIVLLTSGFKFDSKLIREHPDECKDALPPVPEHQEFSLEYRIPATREPSGDVEVFKKVREQWKRKGDFLLDDGDVLYRSQPITLPSKSLDH